MFESVKQGNRRDGIVYLTSLLASLLAHAVILCMVIIVPLVFFGSLHADELLIILEPPSPPPAPQPPAPPPAMNAAATNRREAILEDGVAPQTIPDGIPAPKDDIDPASVVTALAAIHGLNGQGSTGGNPSAIPGWTIELAEPPTPPPPPPKHPPVRVAILEASKLIYQVAPVYPELARKARISGPVVLEANIDEDGNVSTLRVLSGHPLLAKAAIEAVQQWKYSRTVLNGEPVPIIAAITVQFHLN